MKTAGMKYVRIHADETGKSHFADAEVRLSPVVLSLTLPALEAGEPVAASQILFLRLPPGWTTDWHPAPAYQYHCILGGQVELTVGDGERRRFSQGDVILMQDIAGQGHIARVVGEEELLVAVTQLA